VSNQPRVTPGTVSEFDDRTGDLVSRLNGFAGRELNIFSTLALNPLVFRRWVQFGDAFIVRNALPIRERELLILRTAWRCRSRYEWAQHARVALANGLDRDMLEAICIGPSAPNLSEEDAALLTAVDELHDDATLSDRTWAALAINYDTATMIELLMLIGNYHMVAFTLNALGVEVEVGSEPFPDEA